MTEHKLVPKIRFQGFSEEWKEKKLRDIVNIKAGGDVSKNKIKSVGKYPVIGNAINNDGTIGFLDTYQVNAPAVTITARGYIGHSQYRDKPFTPVVRLLALSKKNNNVNMRFIAYSIKKIKFFVESTGVPQLTSPQLGSYIINLTNINEQQKIGDLFSKLDKLIELQQQKVDKLELLKKVFLQKMFANEKQKVPEIRFIGFEEKWTEKRLGDIANFINGRAYKQSELLNHGKYPVLRVGNFYSNTNWYYSDLELPDKNYANDGDLLYTWSATFGPHIWEGKKVIFHYHIWKIELTKFLIRDFTLQILKADQLQLLNTTNGSTMVHITKSNMENKKLFITSLNEQQKIGALFEKLDQIILANNHKLANLKLLKKSLLQNMFI
ncbi:MAG: restriction endonuclease subunit S [Lactobacillus sp.]|uniref:restriction endonuclease subunit S n=1 Tax=Bombilactobacillus bombi TaxID=1303590 RepID=UPI0035EBF4FF|nr:restriction endonuclease subunit S [Lactobacillus sp.]